MLIANNAALRWLLEYSLDMVSLYDASGVMIYCTPSVHRNTGYTIEELSGMANSELTHPDDSVRARATFEKAYESPGVALPLLIRQRYKDGTWHWLEGTVTNLLNEAKVDAVVCCYRDITDRLNADESLRKSLRMMAHAERIANFGSWEFDMTDPATLEGNVLRWSDEVFRIFGYEPGEIEVTIEKFYDAVHPEDRERVRAASMMSFSTFTKISFDHRIVRPDGTVRWVHEEAAVDKEQVSSSMMRVWGTVQDITNLKLAEIERADAVKALVVRNSDLEHFAFLVSHDLRSPVATILGIGALLQEEKLDDSTRTECIAGLVVSIEKVDEVITDLNSVLAGDTRAREQQTTVRFADVVRDVSLVLGLRPRDLIITTDFSAAEDAMTVKSFLHSIFQNLIANSVKYCRPGTPATLHISSLRTDTAVIVSFTDNCLGIDLLKHKDTIFGMGQRFHPHIEGRGMGLYMVKTQIEALGGTINVRSTLNEGTVFILEFNR